MRQSAIFLWIQVSHPQSNIEFAFQIRTLKKKLDLSKIMKESRDEQQLRHAWKEWHDKSGIPIRQYYKPYVEFSNEIAQTNS